MDCVVENDGPLVIDEFADGRKVQFWSCRRGSNCHVVRHRGCCEVESPRTSLLLDGTNDKPS